MSARSTVTVRLPRAWIGRVDSERLRCWLLDFCKNATSNLPPDPGSGNFRASFSIPKRQVKFASAVLDCGAGEALRRIIASRAALPAARSSFPLPAPRDYELPRAKVLPIPRVIGSPAWRRVPEFGGWVPQRTLERSPLPALPPSSVRAAMDDPNAPLESPNLLELALEVVLILGMAVLAVWGVMWLFRASPKPSVPAAAPVSVPMA